MGNCFNRTNMEHQSNPRAIVICLGYILHKDGRMDQILKDRLQKAAQVHAEEGQIPLYVSGGDTADCGHTEASSMGRYLRETLGVDEQYISYDHQARNTLENFMYAVDVLEHRFHRNETIRIHLVTSHWHYPRSLALAKAVFKSCSLDVEFVNASCVVPVTADRMQLERNLIRSKLNRWMPKYGLPNFTSTELEEFTALLDAIPV